MATILLVDDDPPQAFVRKSILERRFADVQRVADAAEAFCLIEQPRFAEKLALVVSGLHMPGFRGPAFVDELLARLPSVPVLVLGGAREMASDYTGQGVRFLSRTVPAERMLEAADQLLTEDESKAV